MAFTGPHISFADLRRFLSWCWEVREHALRWRSEDSRTDLLLFRAERRTLGSVPLMGCSASCGFPSPADDYLDRPLDFNELIIENHAATFAVRVAGESMTGAGIFPGDIAVVNRARNAIDGCIVLALIDGEFTIKRYRRRGVRCWLEPANPAFKDIEISDGMTFEVWGVISRCVRML